MALQQEQHVIKGMQRDLTISKFSPEFAFDCQNIRITARDNNTLLSVTNERGTSLIQLKDTTNNNYSINGNVVGYCVLNNYLVLFTTNSSIASQPDAIYRLEPKGTYFEVVRLFIGDLNFDINHPLETLGNYETEDVQKIYWVDGINQPRMINIMDNPVTGSNYYDFKLDIPFPSVSIEKRYDGSGEFPSGVIQYAISLRRRNGQQTPLIYISDLQYLTFADRAGSPEENVDCSFYIVVRNISSQWHYVRLYSIIRTSLNATPTVKLVREQEVTSAVVFTDTNTTGEDIDPSSLLYIGGQNITASTICSKDNTLFLGDIKLNDLLITDEEKAQIKAKSTVTFSYRTVKIDESADSYYPYKSRLNGAAGDITHFKGGETYRIGVQFQDLYGNFSQPVYLGDFTNTLYPYQNNGNYYLPRIQASVYKPTSVQSLYARLVMVVPTDRDRSIIAQGIVLPTVFNILDRYNDSPYSQASWFTRPSENSNLTNIFASTHYQTIHYELQTDPRPDDTEHYPTKDVTTSISNSYYKLSWVVNKVTQGEGEEQTEVIVSFTITLTETNSSYSPTGTNIINGITYTTWNEVIDAVCSHMIPRSKVKSTSPTEDGSQNINTQTQSAEQPKEDILILPPYQYLVDTNIVNLISPEIENITSDLNNVKFRIIGFTTLSNVLSDYSIDASAGFDPSYATVLNHNFTGSGFRTAYPLYRDTFDLWDPAEWFGVNNAGNFWIYPWHHSGSVNGDTVQDDSAGARERTAILNRKIISNLWYFDNYKRLINSSTVSNNQYNFNTNGVTLVQASDDVSYNRVGADGNYVSYYGNCDKVVAMGVDESSDTSIDDTISYYYVYFTPLDDNYPTKEAVNRGAINSQIKFADPVSLKYKSSSHLVFSLQNSSGDAAILPTISSYQTNYFKFNGLPVWYKVRGLIQRLDYVQASTPSSVILNTLWYNTSSNRLYWYYQYNTDEPEWLQLTPDSDDVYVTSEGECYVANGNGLRKLAYNQTNLHQSATDVPQNAEYLYIGEIYRDIDSDVLYGGNTESALADNQWIPIGDLGSFSAPTTTFTLYGTEGDTYFQRYDSLKTYSFTDEDENSIIDIPSFMVETHINIDGRYDRNRGKTNNLSANTTNFNLINPVYSQLNNFFNYRIINDYYNQSYFPTTLTWSTEKSVGEDVDSWTNINMSSSLLMDGDKGKIESLNTFSNEIYCFQKKGISNILFNSRVQIPSSDGVPIEITNGLKVSGKRYISNSIGCSNKWSIAESPSGLYFIDNETNSIYLFNGQIQSLSDKLGLRQWISENNSNSNWDPINYGNFRSFYDKNNNDVYFTNSSTSLCYSELLGQFTSFMSYEKIPAMFNIGAEFYSIKGTQLWHNFSGDYNMFYGEFKPYSITIIANSNEPYDKIFNTIEFRADSWDGNTLINNQTFDTLDVWNEYQHGTSTLANIIGRPSSLKKKFRVWRANIPRDNSNKMDRIRNTWAYVKLSMNTQNTWRTELHDMMIHYFM